MTALKEFARLESDGLWRPEAEGQRREVVLSFGDATLVISDKAGRAMAHWSLPAIERLNVGERPALFTADPDAIETLEISDATMIDAIEKVRKTVERHRPHPGRLRNIGLLATALGIGALAVFWLPDALIREAQTVVPPVKRSEIGATLLGHIQRVTGPTCRSRLGNAALDKLYTRALGPDAGGQAFVVPSGPDRAVFLPGGLIVLNRDLIEDTDDPSVVAGHVISAAAQLRVEDPLVSLLKSSGIGTTVTLLTTGDIPADALRAYAEVRFAAPPVSVPDDVLLDLFGAAGIPSTPYAYAVDVSGETTLGLIEADPMAGQTPPDILSDADWISLQGICG